MSGDEDARALAGVLVGVPSVNPRLEAGGCGEGAVAEVVAGWLAAWGFAVEVTEVEPGRPNVVARRRWGPGRRLLLNGHLDTVGEAGMTVPARGEVRGGRLHGRGSADMKGGLAALLAAARDAAEEALSGELIVALVVDEEHGSAGMRALVEGGLAADAAVVCEPTGLAVMPAHKGFAWVEVRFRGRAAHGSRPEEGVDAIQHAGRYLAALRGLQAELGGRRAHPLLGRGTLHAGLIEGGTAPSVYPAACRLVLERRTLPGETASGVEAELQAVLEELSREIPSLRADLEVLQWEPGTEVALEAPLVRMLEDAVEAAGITPRVAGFSGWVDAALLNHAGIPAVCFGPGDLARAHTADEWVELDEVDAARAVLAGLVRRFLAPGGG
ncbi:MAG: ArgE/DapE family deacylase [Gemmatimonadetes bacterium]|nr:ArgE/DapE family deacylase [Gemmatimonadota bacterium]